MKCGNCGAEVARKRIILEPVRGESCRYCESSAPVSSCPAVKVMFTKNASEVHARDIRSRRVHYEGNDAVVRRGAPPLYFIP